MKTNRHLINLFNVNNSFYFKPYIKQLRKLLALL